MKGDVSQDCNHQHDQDCNDQHDHGEDGSMHMYCAYTIARFCLDKIN